MSLYFSTGSPATELSDDQIQSALYDVFERLGPRQKVAVVPPDYSRYASRAGDLTCMTHAYYRDRLVDVLPAVGTHEPISQEHRIKMFPTVPEGLFRQHDWRRDADTIGVVDAQYVAEQTEGIYEREWPVQLNRLLWQGGHDLILSIGQVVPHEVIGMANYNKNLFVGAGGERGINESHYIGAVYGMERIMGVGDTPLRRILNRAQQQFCGHLPLLYALTVIGSNAAGKSVVRGLYIGDDDDCFWQACELAAQVNITHLPQRLDKVVVYLAPEKFPSTWLGNKAIYRTRKAIATGGELIILAPGVRMFGEDPKIDALIREFGYRTTPEVLAAVEASEDLQQNLSAAAHLIHGSSENRFRVTYCPGHLSADEIESVGYQYASYQALADRYLPVAAELATTPAGPRQTADGEPYYFIADPSLGLWEVTEPAQA